MSIKTTTFPTTVRAKLVPDEEYASEREYFFDDDAFRPEGGECSEIYIFGGYDHKDCYYNADAHDDVYELFIEMTSTIYDIIQSGFGWRNLDEEEINAEILEYVREYFPDMTEDKVGEFYDIADNYDGRDYPNIWQGFSHLLQVRIGILLPSMAVYRARWHVSSTALKNILKMLSASLLRCG